MPAWIYPLLGIVFIVGGLVVLGDLVVATVVSAVFIGICAIVAGAFELIHAFWTKGWGGFLWQILLGLLYIAGGAILVSQPVSGALFLTWLLGIFLIASGLARIFVGVGSWSNSGALLCLSGVFALIAGLVILSGWPTSGLWVIGLLLGIDLIFNGVGWLVLAWRPAASTA
jgi:uncharacterized membrane protein HdeD (DUF308 family)